MVKASAAGPGTDLADRPPSRSARSVTEGPARPSRERAKLRTRLEIGLFSGPAVFIFITFVLLPVALAAYYSFFRWNGIEPLDDFIGFENYTRALQDPVFLGAIKNNLIFVVFTILVQLPIALIVALLMNRRMRGRSVFRAIIFAPYVVSEVIAGVMWVLILQPRGMANSLLESIGLGNLTELWLADRGIVVWTLVFVISWKYIGLAIILFLAGLSNIPEDLSEAAQIDGASWWQIQRLITIPLLRPTIRVWLFLSMIGSLQLFDLIWVMTGGGPANASAVMATYMIDRGFRRAQFGYGSAVAVILFIISLIVALIFIRTVLRRDNRNSEMGLGV